MALVYHWARIEAVVLKCHIKWIRIPASLRRGQNRMIAESIHYLLAETLYTAYGRTARTHKGRLLTDPCSIHPLAAAPRSVNGHMFASYKEEFSMSDQKTSLPLCRSGNKERSPVRSTTEVLSLEDTNVASDVYRLQRDS